MSAYSFSHTHTHTLQTSCTLSLIDDSLFVRFPQTDDRLLVSSWRYGERQSRCCKVGQMFIRRKQWTGGAVLWAGGGGYAEKGQDATVKEEEGEAGEGLKSCAVGQSGGGVGRAIALGRRGSSCVPAHPVCALQGQGLGLVW